MYSNQKDLDLLGLNMFSKKTDIYRNKYIITVILNNQYRNGKGTGLNVIPKFQYPVSHMAVDRLGT